MRSSTQIQSDLNALEAAIASGARRVAYNNQSVEYRDLHEMQEAAERLRAQLGQTSPVSIRIKTSKGL